MNFLYVKKGERSNSLVCVQLFSICTQNWKNSNYFLVKTVKAKRAPVTISASVVLPSAAHIEFSLFFVCSLLFASMNIKPHILSNTQRNIHFMHTSNRILWSVHVSYASCDAVKKMVIRWWICAWSLSFDWNQS